MVKPTADAQDAVWAVHTASAHAVARKRVPGLKMLEKGAHYAGQGDILFLAAFLASYASTDVEQVTALMCIMLVSLAVILKELISGFRKDPGNLINAPFANRCPVSVPCLVCALFILELGGRGAYISRWLCVRWALVRSPLVLTGKVSRMADTKELLPGRVGAVMMRFAAVTAAAVVMEQLVWPQLLGEGAAVEGLAAEGVVETVVVEGAAGDALPDPRMDAVQYAVELAGLTVAEMVLYTLALYCDFRHMLYAPVGGVVLLPPTATWQLGIMKRFLSEQYLRELFSPENEWIFRMGLGLKHPLILITLLGLFGVAGTPLFLALLLTLLDPIEAPPEHTTPEHFSHRCVLWVNSMKRSAVLRSVSGVLNPPAFVEARLATQNAVELCSMYDSRNVEGVQCHAGAAPALELLKSRPETPQGGKLPMMKTLAYRVLYSALYHGHTEFDVDEAMLDYFIKETRAWVAAVHGAVSGTTPVPDVDKLVKCPAQSVPLLMVLLYQKHPLVAALRADAELAEQLVDIIVCRGYAETMVLRGRYDYALGTTDVQQHVSLKCLALLAVLLDNWRAYGVHSRRFVTQSTIKVSFTLCTMFKTRPMQLTKMLAATAMVYYKAVLGCLERNSDVYVEDFGARPELYHHELQRSSPFYHVILMMLVALDLGQVDKLPLLVPILNALEAFNTTAGESLLECSPGMLARQVHRISLLVVNVAPRAAATPAQMARPHHAMFAAITSKCLTLLVGLMKLSPMTVQFMTQNEGVTTLLFSSLVDHPDSGIQARAVELLDIIQAPNDAVPTPQTHHAITSLRYTKPAPAAADVAAEEGGAPEADLVRYGEETCCVCLTDFEPDEELGRLPCGHVFHKACIKVWLYNKDRCPKCRAPVVAPSLAGVKSEPEPASPVPSLAAAAAAPEPVPAPVISEEPASPPEGDEMQAPVAEPAAEDPAPTTSPKAIKRKKRGMQAADSAGGAACAAPAAASQPVTADDHLAVLNVDGDDERARRAAALIAQQQMEEQARKDAAMRQAAADAAAKRAEEAAAARKAAEDAAQQAAADALARKLAEEEAERKHAEEAAVAAEAAAAPAEEAATSVRSPKAIKRKKRGMQTADSSAAAARATAAPSQGVTVEDHLAVLQDDDAGAANKIAEELARREAEAHARRAAEAEAARIRAEEEAEAAAWKAAEEEMAQRRAARKAEEAAKKAAEEEAARRAAEEEARRVEEEAARKRAEEEAAMKAAEEEAAWKAAEEEIARRRAEEETAAARRAEEQAEAERRAGEEAARKRAEEDQAKKAAAAEAARIRAEEEAEAAAWKAAEEEMAQRRAARKAEEAAKKAAEEEAARRAAEEEARRVEEEAARKRAEEEAAQKAEEEEAARRRAEEAAAQRRMEEEAEAARLAEEEAARRAEEEAARRAAEEEARRAEEQRRAEEEAEAARLAEEEEAARRAAAAAAWEAAEEEARAQEEKAAPVVTESGIKRKKRGMRSVA